MTKVERAKGASFRGPQDSKLCDVSRLRSDEARLDRPRSPHQKAANIA